MRDSIESGNGVHLMKVNVELDKPTQINRLPMTRKITDKEGKDDASLEQLKLMYEKQNGVLKNVVNNNKALVAFVNGLKQRFEKFRTAH